MPTASLFFLAPLLPFPLALCFRGALSSFRRCDLSMIVVDNDDKNADGIDSEFNSLIHQ